jgi:hypothetical protein
MLSMHSPTFCLLSVKETMVILREAGQKADDTARARVANVVEDHRCGIPQQHMR